MKETMRYTLSLLVSISIIVIVRIDELKENIKTAQEFSMLNKDEMLAIEEKVKPHHKHLMFL
jgi:hypothetical protein